jgi:hypothetical protein
MLNSVQDGRGKPYSANPDGPRTARRIGTMGAGAPSSQSISTTTFG